MHLITWGLIIAVTLCNVSPSLGAGECTVDGEKVKSGKTWKSEDECRSCRCRKGKCKIRTLKKAKCQTTTTTGPTTTEVVFENIFPEHNETDEVGSDNNTLPVPPIAGRGGYIWFIEEQCLGGYEVITLTDSARFSNTNDNFKIRFYAGGVWTHHVILNNPGYDRQIKCWDRYGPLEGWNDDPVDWVQITHVSGTDGWRIYSIFVRQLCTNKIYEFKCGGCWVDSPGIPFRYIKRTN